MKKLSLVLLILVGIVVLTGCSIVFDCCTPPITPPVQTCSLTVTAGFWIWGTVYINGQSTGQYIDYSIPSMKSVTVSVPCNQQVCVIIVDPCGVQSHAEWVYINPGQNSLYFAYW